MAKESLNVYKLINGTKRINEFSISSYTLYSAKCSAYVFAKTYEKELGIHLEYNYNWETDVYDFWRK